MRHDDQSFEHGGGERGEVAAHRMDVGVRTRVTAADWRQQVTPQREAADDLSPRTRAATRTDPELRHVRCGPGPPTPGTPGREHWRASGHWRSHRSGGDSRSLTTPAPTTHDGSTTCASRPAREHRRGGGYLPGGAATRGGSGPGETVCPPAPTAGMPSCRGWVRCSDPAAVTGGVRCR